MTLSDLAISTTFIIFYVVIAHLARKVLNKFTSIQGLVKELILESLAAAELCSTCFGECLSGPMNRNRLINFLSNNLKS